MITPAHFSLGMRNTWSHLPTSLLEWGIHDHTCPLLSWKEEYMITPAHFSLGRRNIWSHVPTSLLEGGNKITSAHLCCVRKKTWFVVLISFLEGRTPSSVDPFLRYKEKHILTSVQFSEGRVHDPACQVLYQMDECMILPARFSIRRKSAWSCLPDHLSEGRVHNPACQVLYQKQECMILPVRFSIRRKSAWSCLSGFLSEGGVHDPACRIICQKEECLILPARFSIRRKSAWFLPASFSIRRKSAWSCLPGPLSEGGVHDPACEVLYQKEECIILPARSSVRRKNTDLNGSVNIMLHRLFRGLLLLQLCKSYIF